MKNFLLILLIISGNFAVAQHKEGEFNKNKNYLQKAVNLLKRSYGKESNAFEIGNFDLDNNDKSIDLIYEFIKNCNKIKIKVVSNKNNKKCLEALQFPDKNVDFIGSLPPDDTSVKILISNSCFKDYTEKSKL